MKDNESDDPTSWATLFCRLFAHVAKEVVEKFGDEGEQAIKDGVWAFGVERGRNIAERVRKNGCEINAENYLSNYDMGRGDDFTAQNIYGDDQVEQLFTQCGFADQWIADGMEKYGKLYCDMIDPAIAKGYCEDMECIHSKRVYEDGVCAFCFRMNKKEA
ncbi:hypothetical protein D3Z62_08245 [Lachnospiraceae bacterium]|nr:hypothetical protein [Lachnospiraceae bacterium]